MSVMPPLLELRGIAHSYGPRLALEACDLTLHSGKCLLLMGPNGAGKSTLLGVILSRFAAQSGEIHFLGKRLDGLAERRRLHAACGFVGYRPGLYMDLSAEENLRHFLSLHFSRMDRTRLQESNDLLQRLGLWARRKDRVRSYSRGMQQRLALARALCTGPRLLLLDEPAANLDREGAGALEAELQRYLQQGGAVLAATHEEMRLDADRLHYMFLRNGRVMASIDGVRFNEAARKKVRTLLFGNALSSDQ